jgi:hypothetical protein
MISLPFSVETDKNLALAGQPCGNKIIGNAICLFFQLEMLCIVELCHSAISNASFAFLAGWCIALFGA